MGIKSTITEAIIKSYSAYADSTDIIMRSDFACCHYLTRNWHEPIYNVNDIIKSVHKTSAEQLLIAYTLLTNKRILITRLPTVSTEIINTDGIITEINFATDVRVYNNYNEFFNLHGFAADTWSEYDGMYNNRFNFDKFFYDNTKTLNDSTGAFVLYSDGALNNRIYIRGYYLTPEFLINKKIQL